MMDRRGLFGMCLIITVGSRGFGAENNSVKGSMTVDGKTYTLTCAKAYRIKSDGKDSVAVIVSQKRFELTKPKLFPKEKPRWISLMEISEPTQFEEIRDVIPHLQVIFDEKTGKVRSYQGSTGGHTFMSLSENVTTINGVRQPLEVREVEGNWIAKIEGNQIIGSGNERDFKGNDAYDFEFKASIEQIEFDDPTKPSSK